MKAKLKQVIPGVYHLVFESQRELASTFMRFQEFYESPKYNGKVFSRKEFIQWYSKEYGHGKFTYFNDWSGFNLPDYVLRPFYDGKFDPLTKQEKKLLSIFKDTKSPFYIIATFGDEQNEMVVAHEIAHGMWYLNKNYRSKAKKIVRSLKPKTIKTVRAFLSNKGYGRNVLEDESHAYLVTNARIIRAFARLHDVELNKEWRKVVALQKLYVRTSKFQLPSSGEAK